MGIEQNGFARKNALNSSRAVLSFRRLPPPDGLPRRVFFAKIRFVERIFTNFLTFFKNFYFLKPFNFKDLSKN
jgi:hypothetical protein